MPQIKSCMFPFTQPNLFFGMDGILCVSVFFFVGVLVVVVVVSFSIRGIPVENLAYVCYIR